METDRRQFLKHAAAASGALSLPALLAACGSSGSSSSTTAGTSTGAAGGGLAKGMRVGFTHPAAQAGIVAVLANYGKRRMESEGGQLLVGALQNATPEEQFSLIEGWISQKLNAVVVFPIDPQALAPLQQRAQAEGVHWITYLVPMKGDEGTVGPSPKSMGELLGKGVVDWHQSTKKGKKALVLEFQPIPTTQERVEIPIDMLRAQTDVEIVSRQDSVDSSTALDITESTLRAHPDLDIVIALTDDAGVGALRAFENAGKNADDCFIGGCDGTQEALEAIRRGSAYKASAASDVKAFGEDIANQPINLAHGGKPQTLPVPAMLVTPKDTAELDKLLSRFQA